MHGRAAPASPSSLRRSRMPSDLYQRNEGRKPAEMGELHLVMILRYAVAFDVLSAVVL